MKKVVITWILDDILEDDKNDVISHSNKIIQEYPTPDQL